MQLDHAYIDETDLAARYLDDGLPAEERAAFDAHLENCEECADRLQLARLMREGAREADEKARETARQSLDQSGLERSGLDQPGEGQPHKVVISEAAGAMFTGADEEIASPDESGATEIPVELNPVELNDDEPSSAETSTIEPSAEDEQESFTEPPVGNVRVNSSPVPGEIEDEIHARSPSGTSESEPVHQDLGDPPSEDESGLTQGKPESPVDSDVVSLVDPGELPQFETSPLATPLEATQLEVTQLEATQLEATQLEATQAIPSGPTESAATVTHDETLVEEMHVQGANGQDTNNPAQPTNDQPLRIHLVTQFKAWQISLLIAAAAAVFLAILVAALLWIGNLA